MGGKSNLMDLVVVVATATCKQGSNIHWIELIITAAIIAVHLDFAILFQHFSHFIRWQCQQSIGAALT
ncbi:hypothetical protein D3C85_1735890 [compost metagenome]